ACCRRKQAEPMCGLARIDLFWASLVWLSERMGRVAFQKGVYWYKSSEVSPEGCRVDSGHMLCGRGSNLRTDDHPARTQCERNHRRSMGKMLLTITNPFGASA